MTDTTSQGSDDANGALSTKLAKKKKKDMAPYEVLDAEYDKVDKQEDKAFKELTRLRQRTAKASLELTRQSEIAAGSTVARGRKKRGESRLSKKNIFMFCAWGGTLLALAEEDKKVRDTLIAMTKRSDHLITSGNRPAIADVMQKLDQFHQAAV